MLTKTDLSQIRKVVREEVESESQETRSDLQGEMKLMRMRIENRLDAIENKVKDVDIKTTNLQKTLHKAQLGIKRARRDIKGMIEMFDSQDVKLVKRVDEIETRLGPLNN